MAEYPELQYNVKNWSPENNGKDQKCCDKRQAVQAMRDLISTRPDIGFLRTDDEFLSRFLYARKFRIKESFELYSNYYLYRQKNKEFFRDFNVRHPPVYQALCDGFPGVLPQPDKYGRPVLLIFASNWDSSRYPIQAIYKAILLTLENLVESIENQVNGFVIVIDWSGFSLRQSTNLSPSSLRLMIEGLQDCFPARFKGIHFINQPWYVEAVLTFIKPFLKDKTKDKIFLHGNNLSTLHQHVNYEILPAELGGELPAFHTMSWAKRLISSLPASLTMGELEQPFNTAQESVGLRKSETFPT